MKLSDCSAVPELRPRRKCPQAAHDLHVLPFRLGFDQPLEGMEIRKKVRDR